MIDGDVQEVEEVEGSVFRSAAAPHCALIGQHVNNPGEARAQIDQATK